MGKSSQAPQSRGTPENIQTLPGPSNSKALTQEGGRRPAARTAGCAGFDARRFH